MNSDALTYYQKQLENHQLSLKKTNKKLLFYSLSRLLVFFIIVFGIYYFRENSNLLLPFIIIGIALFIFLVSIHTNVKRKKEKEEALIYINETEIKALDKDFYQLATGEKFIDALHHYSYDIDLFGNKSFFQYMNRTATLAGKKVLANYLLANDITAIKDKQNAIKELSKIPNWRQNFSAIASLLKTNYTPEKIIHWIKNYTSFTNKGMYIFSMLFLLGTITTFILTYLNIIHFKFIFVWFFLGLMISGIFLKKVNNLYSQANKAKDTFRQYYQLLLWIESQEFKAKNNIEQQKKIQTESSKASAIFKEFSKALDALDQRNNMLFGMLANGFSLWDVKQTYKVEKWINKYKSSITHWFDVVAYFDAQNSLANFSFNHANYVFPILQENEIIKAEKLGHPLLIENKRIDNDFSINKEHFFIITGANMAGKSTFLRTVSLSIVMANAGLPVCAKQYVYKPIKLISSMRTSDSLADDESYFFSELKRLKQIVTSIEKDTYFIILDEILKGTNSKDKAEGSKQFVQKLVASNSTGIIATHDLSLCTLEKEEQQIKNYYFDAEIIEDELHFDYTFKKGVCQNMNASFLLKKMGIV